MQYLPIDRMKTGVVPASPLVEAVFACVQDRVRQCYDASGQPWETFCAAGSVQAVSQDDFAQVEARLLASGHRFAWSAGISLQERPDAYQNNEAAGAADGGFSHPNAPSGDPDAAGRALRGVGDNVVRHERNLTGIARYIRTNEQVLAFLSAGVPPHTIAVIDDSGGTLTAPIIEQFAGVICAGGTVRSHLGILTREYNIPCLMNAKVAGIKDGDRICVEVSAPAKTTEDYQRGIERVANIWLLSGEAGK